MAAQQVATWKVSALFLFVTYAGDLNGRTVTTRMRTFLVGERNNWTIKLFQNKFILKKKSKCNPVEISSFCFFHAGHPKSPIQSGSSIRVQRANAHLRDNVYDIALVMPPSMANQQLNQSSGKVNTSLPSQPALLIRANCNGTLTVMSEIRVHAKVNVLQRHYPVIQKRSSRTSTSNALL